MNMGVVVMMVLLGLIAALAIGLIIALSKLHEARRGLARGFPLDPVGQDYARGIGGAELAGQVVGSRSYTRVISNTQELKDISPQMLEQLMKGVMASVGEPGLGAGGMRVVLSSDNQAEAEGAMKRLSMAGISAAMDVHVENGACTAKVSVAEQYRVRAASLLGVRQVQ